MNKLFTLATTFICISNVIIAQTGPAGIGNSTTNKIWYDANTLGLVNNTAVTNWTDVSGNGQNASQATSNQRPIFNTNQLNGFPSVSFDGSNDRLTLANASGVSNQAITWFIVGNYNTTAVSQSMLHFAHTGSTNHKNLRFSICYNNGATIRINSGNINTTGGGTPANFTFTTASQVMSTSITATTITTHTNGTQTGTNTGVFLSPVGANLFVTLGMRAFLNDYPLNGKIAEVAVYNYTLTTPERVIVENYLSSKYALAMTSNERYAMEGSGHHFNVTGIGMEGGNSVTSNHGGSLVTINNASALANGDYLMWGHDNVSLAVNNTDVPPIFSSFGGTRLNRTWRVDETGDVGDYTLAVNMATMPALGASTADYVLMIDDDGDFSNGGTTYHTTGYTFAANTATWTNVDLTDGDYFTVAYVPAIFSITTGNWSDNTTWNCNCIPTNADDVFISATDVVTVDGPAETNNFSIVATGSLLFGGLNVLEVAGDLDNQGTFDGTTGRLTMNGGAAQTINSNSVVLLEEFEVDNISGVTVQTGDYTINSIGTYFPTNGNLNVSSANSFVFDSDASGSARIDEMPATASITGDVIFRRFIPAGTGGYRDLAIPLVGGGTPSEFDDDMFISGPTGSGFADGCASSGSGCFYSFKFFVADVYTDITNAATNIPRTTRGVHAWVADGYPAALGAPVTIDISGPAETSANLPIVVTTKNKYTLIGNPYLSQIDFDELNRTNIGDFYYVWDVSIGNFNWYQIANGSSPLTEVLASGQGFVVMPLTNAGTITFEQSDKTPGTATFIRSFTEDVEYFRLSMNRLDMPYSCDVTFNVSDEAENGFDQFDVPTPYGIDTNAVYISAQIDDRIVRCSGMNDKETSVSVPLVIKAPSQGLYSINTQNLELFKNYNCVILEDLATGSRYDLRNMNDVRFNVEKTGEDTRFMLHFSNDACSQIVAGIDINDNESSVEMTNFNDYVKVDMNFASEENVTISFYNMLGQNVLSEQLQNVTDKSVNISIPSALKNGVYLVVVETNKKRYTRKYNF